MFYIQLDENNVIRDVITYAYDGYVPVNLELPMPGGILGGWYRWDGEKPVYDRALFERVNEVPQLQEIKAEYDEVRPAVQSLMMTLLDEDAVSPAQVIGVSAVFPLWSEDWRGKRGDIVRDDGNLYRSLHDVTNGGQNTKPSATPSMWARVGDPGEEWPEWIRPTGAHDAYAKGAKVTHNGKRWVSTVDNNVWEPSIFGWSEA